MSVNPFSSEARALSLWSMWFEPLLGSLRRGLERAKRARRPASRYELQLGADYHWLPWASTVGQALPPVAATQVRVVDPSVARMILNVRPLAAFDCTETV
jgi:hypothetical protein